MKKIIIPITTWRSISSDASRYYALVDYYDDKGDYVSAKIKRPITIEEIEKQPDRFYAIEDNDLTECFSDWKELVRFAKKYIDEHKLDEVVYVQGPE